MHFLYPAFLAALAVLAVPVIVHLFRFRKYRTVIFTRVKFLRDVELETRNRSRLKHLVTMVSRMLALAFLVLSFAIPSCQGPGGSTGKTAVSIYIDNSFSMENGRDGGILFEQAKEKAREIIRSYGDAGIFQVLSNSPSGAHLNFSQPADALRYVDELRISPRFTGLSAVLSGMREDLAARPETGMGYVISDMQQSFTGSADEKTPRPPFLRLVNLGGQGRANIGIDTAWLEQAFVIPGEKNRLFFRLSNHTSEPLEDMPVKLTAGSAMLGMARVSSAAGVPAEGSIEFTPGDAPVQTAALSIDEPGAAFDNKMYLDLSPAAVLKVSVAKSNPYVEGVLDAQRIFRRSTGLPWSDKQEDKTDVLIWTDWSSVSNAEASALLSWVSAGKTAILAPAINADFSSAGQTLGFPALRRSSVKQQISRSGLTHPFFARVFRSVPSGMEMPGVTDFFSSEGSSGTGEPVLSLDNGDPLLLLFRHGSGRLYLFTMPLQAASTDLVRSSLFLPVLTNAMTYGLKNSVLYGVAGSGRMYPLKMRSVQGDAARMLTGEQGQVAAELSRGAAGMELYLGPQPEKAGIYTLEGEAVSINYDRRESNPSPASAQWMDKFTGLQGVEMFNSGNTVLAGSDSASGSRLWRTFIWLSVLFFGIEILALVFWDKLAVKFAAGRTTTP